MPYCTHCNKLFPCQKRLDAHQKSNRCVVNQVNYICTICCNWKSRNKRDYERHIKNCNKNQLKKMEQRLYDKLKRDQEELQKIKEILGIKEKIAEKKRPNIEENKPPNDNSGSIYIIQEREFINNGENTYKIGKTTQNIAVRTRSYPKNSELIYTYPVSDCDNIEKIVIDTFNELFEKMDCYGNEYYRGNVRDMAETINEIIKNNDK